MIFDEVQDCPNARASVKAFMEDGRYDIIETGSLIGLRGYNSKIKSFLPTGSELILQMHPMDFEEFLLAIGVSQDSIESLHDDFLNNNHVNVAVNNKFLDYFKEYICVGGMPEVVDLFTQSNNLGTVYDLQISILEQYKDDFGKHLDKDGTLKKRQNRYCKNIRCI